MSVVFSSPTSVIPLNLFFGCFLDGFCFLKEPAGTVCHGFEAFSRGCILLELEMISFYPHFQNLQIRSNDILQVLIINQEILFRQGPFDQILPLSQFFSAVFS